MALEEDEAIREPGIVESRRRLSESAGRHRTGRDPVTPGEREMRLEGALLARPSPLGEGLAEALGEAGEPVSALRDADPEDARPTRTLEGSGPRDRGVDRRDTDGCASHRLDDGRYAVVRRGPEEAQREVDAVEADPADLAQLAAALARPALTDTSADRLDDLLDIAPDGRRQRDGDEQATPREGSLR
jgi:hypothetical protein